jgi:hypothetical protein
MDLPLRLDLAKLSHFHVVAVFLPLVPGLVAMAGLILGDSSLSHQFSSLPLGYSTKVAIAIAFVYIFGLSATFVVDTICAIVFSKLLPGPTTGMSDGVYWQRVASEYVGSKLSPAHWTWSKDDFDNAAIYFETFPGQEKAFKETWETYKKLVKQYDDAQKSSSQDAAHTDPTASSVGAASDKPAKAQAPDLGSALESIRTNMRSISARLEWFSLRQALQLIPTAVQAPYSTFGSVAEAMRAAAFVGVCMMARYPNLYDPGALLFVLALLITTTWATWLLTKVSSSAQSSGAYQIAVMLHEMRQSSTDGGQRADQRDG